MPFIKDFDMNKKTEMLDLISPDFTNSQWLIVNGQLKYKSR